MTTRLSCVSVDLTAVCTASGPAVLGGGLQVWQGGCSRESAEAPWRVVWGLPETPPPQSAPRHPVLTRARTVYHLSAQPGHEARVRKVHSPIVQLHEKPHSSPADQHAGRRYICTHRSTSIHLFSDISVILHTYIHPGQITDIVSLLSYQT